MATNTGKRENFGITCPYCFAKFGSDRVHFRLQTAHKMGTQAPLPDGYDDWPKNRVAMYCRISHYQYEL